VKVPESCLGALIGKNGTTRARLEAESRIENITIMTSSSEAVLTSRDYSGIQRACKLIMEVVKECELRQQTKSQHVGALAPSSAVPIPVAPDASAPVSPHRRVHKRYSKPVLAGRLAPGAGLSPPASMFQCHLCRKSFSTSSALTDHQRAKGHLPPFNVQPGMLRAAPLVPGSPLSAGSSGLLQSPIRGGLPVSHSDDDEDGDIIYPQSHGSPFSPSDESFSYDGEVSPASEEEVSEDFARKVAIHGIQDIGLRA